MKRLIPLLLACTALAGCMVGPNYQKPDIPTPQAYGEQPTAPGASAQTADLSRWWATFNDPELNSLVERALAQNLDVQTAASRLREARHQVIVARAALLPSVSGSAIAARRDAQRGSDGSSTSPSRSSGSGSSGNGSSGNAGSDGGPLASLPKHLNLYSLGIDANWEIDLFGGARRGVEAANAQAEAANWQGRDTQVALTAEVARTYLALRLAQARKAEAQTDIARIQELLDLVGQRSKVGVATDLDVNQQRQALQAEQAELPQIDIQIRAQVHALGTLLALTPMALDAELAQPAALPAPPAELPVGLPSELLRRRPDIRASERQLAAATAEIGVATAALYPKINLIGLASFAGTDFSSLLSSQNFSTIGAADGSVPIFSGGKLHANVRAKKEEAQQAALAYRQSILIALREVEDALAAYGDDRSREDTLAADLKSALDSEALTNARYKVGLSPFTDVLQTRAQVHTARDQLLQAQSARATDLVTLFTALGGGWS